MLPWPSSMVVPRRDPRSAISERGAISTMEPSARRMKAPASFDGTDPLFREDGVALGEIDGRLLGHELERAVDRGDQGREVPVGEDIAAGDPGHRTGADHEHRRRRRS